jgi:hypothetical protein
VSEVCVSEVCRWCKVSVSEVCVNEMSVSGVY